MDDSERATKESKPRLGYDVERLQTIPKFQVLVDDRDADDEIEPPSKESHFDDRVSTPDWAVWLDSPA
jgi:hypothetical protein